MDLRRVSEILARHLPDGARVLDVGGGDGELLNHLFAARPDITVTMVDVSATVGKFIEAKYRQRVRLLPQTFIETHLAESPGRYDVALISDVLHHIPTAIRRTFLADVRKCLTAQGALFVKDIEPGAFISKLSLFSDKFISGDKQVELISREQLRALAADGAGACTAVELGLLEKNGPNYLMRFEFS